MDTLLDLEEKIRTTTSALGKLEQSFAQNPSRGMHANILSLRKLHTNLQGEFKDAADAAGMDVCQYRLLNDRPSVLALTGVLGAFQEAFSQAFEAVHSMRRKDRRVISSASQRLSTLEVAYSFPGSFGLAFTIPNDKFLLPNMTNSIDRAATSILDVVTSHASLSSVSEMIRTMGRAPVAAIYEWANVSTKFDAGAGIQWERGDRIKANVIVQAQEFAEVSGALEVRSETTTEEISVVGVLVGANVRSGTFQFLPTGADEALRGTFTDAISETQQVKLPSRYLAHMQKNSVLRLATNTESNTYFLEKLEVIDSTHEG